MPPIARASGPVTFAPSSSAVNVRHAPTYAFLTHAAFPPRPIFAQWHTEGCTADLFNIYGTTECSIWAALHRVTFDSYIDDAHCVIGEPLDDTELHVRDGRLFIGGEARLCHVSDEAQPQLYAFLLCIGVAHTY